MKNPSNKVYRLAKSGAYRYEPFGPMMTLAQAQHYQKDMGLAGYSVMVVNMTSL